MPSDRTIDIRNWFGFKKLPFAVNVNTKDIFLTKSIEQMSSKVRFAIQSGFYYVVIGDVGSGKSTAMRYALSQLPSKQYSVATVISSDRSFPEFLRQCANAIGAPTKAFQHTTVLRTIFECYESLRESGIRPVFFIDEAHLLSAETLRQLHLLTIPNLNSDISVPIVLCGQESLFEKLNYPICKPVLSRVMDGFNLKSMSNEECNQYINHQICNIAGGRDDIFDDLSLKAVYQASGGIPRKINSICLLAMQKALENQQTSVCADVIREVTRNWWEK